MIVRVWRAIAAPGNASAYREHLERVVLPQLRELPGFVGITLMQRKRDDRIELLVSSRWESMAAVCAFAGTNPERAVVEPAARSVLIGFDHAVSHYEVSFEAGTA
ncbi:MAG TPA: antibiotic biosynthesis monooxygenase [Hyphomicrobiaceae bacterium]|jgi:heme-degrading monooxygenase HmoA|nr:antibiotic biosynthesis monooxygenase [Hyphomicrobiaceae bacterium]